MCDLLSILDVPSKPGDAFKVSSVTLNPDPPMKATQAQITVNGTLGTATPGGSVSLVITYVPLKLKVFSQNYNLCDLVACPAAPGPISGMCLGVSVSVSV